MGWLDRVWVSALRLYALGFLKELLEGGKRMKRRSVNAIDGYILSASRR